MTCVSPGRYIVDWFRSSQYHGLNRPAYIFDMNVVFLAFGTLRDPNGSARARIRKNGRQEIRRSIVAAIDIGKPADAATVAGKAKYQRLSEQLA
jgi:hypothetical protein